MSSYTPVFLLKDENGNRGYGWHPKATETLYGVVKPDGVTITAQDGVLSAANAGANQDLSNLSSIGNAKFQYAPFAINSGSIDSSGANNTLSAAGGVPVPADVYIVPVLSANTSDYGTCSNYAWTQGDAYTYRGTSTWTMDLAADNHIPAGAAVSFTISSWSYFNPATGSGSASVGIKGCNVVYTYIDDTTETVFDENNTGNFAGWSTFTDTVRSANVTISNNPAKEVKKITVNVYPIGGGTVNQVTAANLNFRAQYTISSADTLICSACTITTADNRTKTFNADNILDCSSLPDGSYKAVKDYETGNLSAVSSLTVSKTEPLNPASGALWLDNSMYPLSLKQYDGSNWQTNNDLVYIGDVTVSSGVITAVKNNEFNKYLYLLSEKPVLIETYQNGASWYRIYSDGWCEQGGYINPSSTNEVLITLLKSYIDTNYSCAASSADNRTPLYIGQLTTKTVSQVPIRMNSTSQAAYWRTCGYIR